jgi:hypothetical protein
LYILNKSVFLSFGDERTIESRLMDADPDYAVCINQNAQKREGSKLLEMASIIRINKKTRQLLIQKEKVCVCRFIQTV